MILKGKTQKGKNRIRELGSSWFLIRTQEVVHFSKDPGPWGLFQPDMATDDKARWINLKNDKDFEISFGMHSSP